MSLGIKAILLTWSNSHTVPGDMERIHICSVLTRHCCPTRLSAWTSSILPLHLLSHWDTTDMCSHTNAMLMTHDPHPLLSSYRCSCPCLEHSTSGSKSLKCFMNFYIVLEMRPLIKVSRSPCRSLDDFVQSLAISSFENLLLAGVFFPPRNPILIRFNMLMLFYKAKNQTNLSAWLDPWPYTQDIRKTSVKTLLCTRTQADEWTFAGCPNSWRTLICIKEELFTKHLN